MPALRSALRGVFVMLINVACSTQPPQAARSAPIATPQDGPKPDATPQPSPLAFSLIEIKSWPATGPAVTAMGHHIAPNTRVEVRVSPNARASYVELSAGMTLPVGTVIFATHRSGERELDAFAMEKRAATGWTFLRLSPSGAGVAANGALCQRCHDEGSADSLFGPARANP